jgi:hypothetical protein
LHEENGSEGFRYRSQPVKRLLVSGHLVLDVCVAEALGPDDLPVPNDGGGHPGHTVAPRQLPQLAGEDGVTLVLSDEFLNRR